jgi:hypothetical protein
MSEWGIPDWTDPASYGDTESWSLKRWRWEFLRRRDDLRREFDLNASIEYESRLIEAEQQPWRFPYGIPPPNRPGFYILSPSITADTWEPLPNPRISDQPEKVLIESSAGVTLLAHGETVGEEPKETILKFDLRKPISAQIVEAKKYLVEQQEAQIGEKVQFRPRIDRWLKYLRIWDAREHDCPWEKIAEVLSDEGQFDSSWVNKAHKAALRLSWEFKI